MRPPRSSFRPRGATLWDLVIVLCVLMILGGGTLPQIICRSRETANRVKCASSLKQIGLAILLYSNDNGGEYPRTMHDPTTAATTAYTGWQSPAPFSSTGPVDNDVTAALYLLLRTQPITSQPFVCPTQQNAVAWNFNGAGAASFSNFPHRGVLSYGYANPYPTAAAIKLGYRLTNSISAEFAVAADMSPGGAALAALRSTDSMKQMKTGNSANHDREGQCVLFGDGHVEFLQNPFVGVARDNVFTAAGGPVLPGQAFATSPLDANDSVILPTALDGPPPPAAAPTPWYLWLSTWITIGVIAVWLLMFCLLRPMKPARPAA